MKTTEKLKQQLHSLIDTIDNEQVLKVLTDDIVPFVINSHIEENGNEEDNLSPEEMAELDAAYKKMEAEDLATMASFREAISKFRSA